MRTALRLAVLLLTWVALGAGVAWAAPVAQPKTATVGTTVQLYSIPAFSSTLDANQTVTSYRFETVPAVGLVAYPANTNGTGGYTAAAAGTSISAAQAANLVYQPANGATPGQTTFNYSVLQSNNARSANALYTINLVPSANSQTAVIMSNTNGPTSIPALTATGGTPSKYRILTLPAVSSGVLYVNGVAATANQDITVAQASQLTFDPAAGFYGTGIFSYAALDASNNVSPSAQYSLPITSAGCGQAGAVDFSRRTLGEDWKAATATVNGTTITTSGYSTSVTGTNTNTFAVANNATLPGPSLVWQQNNIGNNPTTVSNVAQVTFTFSRPVNGLSIAISDIDKDITNANFTDEVVFNGYGSAGSSTPIALSSANVALGTNNTNTYAGSNTVQGTNVNTSDAAGTVVVTFPSAVQRVTLIYRNTAAYVSNTTDRTQTIGIPSMTWCSQADVTTTIAAQTSPVAAGTQGQFNVTFANNGVDVAAQGVAPQVQLPAGLTNVVASNGGTYNSTTGLVTYPGITTLTVNQTQSSTITFTAPATGPVAATASISTTTDEGANTATNSASTNIAVTPVLISGRVFEDVNYGGGAGRSLATANTSATGSGFANNAILRSGATVELYNSSGTLVGTTTTDATGTYSFNAPVAGSYTVRVVNSTVTSTRGGYVAGLLPVQTFVNGDVNRVGGEAPEKQDAAANSGSQTLTALTAGTVTPQSIATVSATTSGLNNVDFGFNFDVISNTNDAGQGSLRQFLLNSNALANTSLAQTGLTAGVETSIFMIPDGVAHSGLRSGLTNQLTNGAAVVTLSTTTGALPDINGANAAGTSLNGSTQTTNVGNTNAAVTTAGSESTGPEVIINFGGTDGFAARVDNTRIIGLGLTNANTTQGSGAAALRIETGATNALVQNNTFYASGANLRINGVGGATVTGNISRNAISNNSDGIELTGSSSNTISNNQFLNNAGYGIDFISGTSNSNTITGNLFSGNGQNTSNGQTAGIGLRDASSYNQIIGNTFTANLGDGISALGGGSANIFSQNSFSNNGDLAIDLTNSTNNNGDGVTLNDGGDTDGGTNGLMNFPVLTAASVNGTNLVVTGFARPGALIEFYLAAPDPTNFGEGASFLISRAEGSTDDTNGGSGSYGPASVNGLSQGQDVTNLFTFTIPLSGLTAAQRTALLSGTGVLTSTATLNAYGAGTSEFSGNLAVAVTDITVSLAGPTTLYAGQATGTYSATFTNEGPATASSVTRTVTLPAGASLTTAQQNAIRAAYPGATFPSATTIDFGSLTSLATNASSTVSFAFTAPTTISNSLTLTAGTSTTTSEGNNNAPNQAVLTLNTVAAADVTASITASSTTTTGTFNVTFGNNGPQTAAGVTPTVQLPAGLTGVTVPAGWTYTSSTGLVTYTAGATTLNSGSSLSLTIGYPLANSATPVTATALVSTTTNEGGVAANNVASATVAAAFDLTTTLSGPTTTIAGSPTTLYVTMTNNGPNTAINATQTVTIPSATALSGLYITNGGTYAYSNGIGTVTFPALSNVPSGQTVTNSISFLAPTAAFAPAAVVNTTGTETSTTNNTAYLNGNVGSTSVSVTPATTSATNESTTITADATVVNPGTTVTYTVTATNNGPTATTAVVQQVQLLPGLTTSTLKVGGATGTLLNGTITFGTTATYNTTTGVLTYTTLPNQASGATQTFASIALTAPAAIGNNGQLLATASVSTALSDNVPADNVSSVAVKVRTAPDVATSIAGPSSTIAGLPATYVVKFTNGGSTDAATVTETAQLPAGLSGVVVTDASGNVVSNAYNSATGLVTFPSVTTDVTGATQYYTIVLTAPGQNFPVTSSIASVTSDGVSTNNSASLTTAVTANSDVAVSITGPTTAVIGNPVTYIITTTNNGPTPTTNTVASVQLPAGLTIQASGPGTTNYNSSTGLLTFATTATLVPGGSAANYVTFTMPNATGGLINAVASVTTGSTDQIASNNTAALTTSIAPATTEIADLVTSVSLTTPSGAPTSVPAGTTVGYTVAYRNASGNTATNVMPTANLPVGLSAATLQVGGVTGTQSGNVITFSSGPAAGATYDVTTGLLTFPTIASLPVSATATSYTVSFPAPVGSGQLVVISEVTASTSDNVLTNNRANSSITINTVYDVVTSLAGPATAPAGSTNTYTVTTLNNGPSTASTATTQTVTVPAGSTVTNLPSGANYTSGTGVITFASVANLPAGVANAVVNSFSVVMPASGSLALSATVASANESNTGNDNAALTTTQLNIAPVAQNVWNTLQNARGNTANLSAATGLAISPLSASDADGSIASYTITSLPTAAQGVLYYNGAAVTAGQTVAASGLSFAPTAGYVGNATFTYTATDNGGLVSPAALYTIPVAQDLSSVYANAPNRGGSASNYTNGDLIAGVIDANTARYNASGVVYDNTVANGTIATASGADNGVRSASVDQAGANLLASLGLTLNTATGDIRVSNRNLLRGGSYTVTITTVDANGGTNTQTVTFAIGFGPLPVTLMSFTAQAQNTDALLTWTTAQEKNNDHFDVERSIDGVHFEKVGELAGHGTVTNAQHYRFVDASAARFGTAVFYRLRQVDTDGTTILSDLRTVSFSKQTTVELTLFPNPATDVLNVRLSGPATQAAVTVYSATGALVLKGQLDSSLSTVLDVRALPAGTYLVKVQGSNGLPLTRRFVKN